MDLEHVLGVQLAGVGEVVAAGEDVVVGDGDLRVHEVVHVVATAVRRRVLAGEASVAEDAGDERAASRSEFPFSSHWWKTPRICVPSTDAGDVDLPVGDALGEGAEDRARREDRRADADRRRARLIRCAMRVARASPWPGENQVRTCRPPTSIGSGSTKPLCSTEPVVQSCSKSFV